MLKLTSLPLETVVKIAPEMGFADPAGATATKAPTATAVLPTRATSFLVNPFMPCPRSRQPTVDVSADRPRTALVLPPKVHGTAETRPPYVRVNVRARLRETGDCLFFR